MSVSYSPADVLSAVPSIWDRDHAVRYRSSWPAGKTDVHRSTDVRPDHASDRWDAAADTQRAWRRARLPLRQRQLIFLVGYLGLDFTEAGALLGIAHNTAHVTFHRGLRNLTSELGHAA